MPAQNPAYRPSHPHFLWLLRDSLFWRAVKVASRVDNVYGTRSGERRLDGERRPNLVTVNSSGLAQNPAQFPRSQLVCAQGSWSLVRQ